MPYILRTDILGYYAFLDPAGGKKHAEVKKVRARSAIVVAGVDAANRLFIFKAWAERCTTPVLLEEIYRTAEQFPLTVFGIESSAQQTLFVDMVAVNAEQARKKLPLRPHPQPTNITKEFRIRTQLQKRLAAGRIFLQPDMHDLKDEIVSFPMSTTVDLVDALASLTTIIPERMSLNEEAEEEEQRLQYLRDSGAPPEYIRQVAAGQDGNSNIIDWEGWAVSRGFGNTR